MAVEEAFPSGSVEGFTIGQFIAVGSDQDYGDAWVRAPDGGVASLVWETGEPDDLTLLIEPDPQGRWGTWAVRLSLPMTTDAEATEYLRALLPRLRPQWEAWRNSRR